MGIGPRNIDTLRHQARLWLSLVLTLISRTVLALDVGGQITEDTVWSDTSEPYLIASPIQIGPGVSLEISRGVTVKNGQIEVFGVLDAVGTQERPVVFQNVNIRPGPNSDPPFQINLSFVDFDGFLYEPTGHGIYGSLAIRDSLVRSPVNMYIWYPTSDVFIERNLFVNGAGISTGSSDAQIFIRNNFFAGSGGAIYTGAFIENWAAYGEAPVVEFNTFPKGELAVALPSGYNAASIFAENNWWGTTNTSSIETMIFDRDDDFAAADYIDYVPFLTEPHPDTPLPDLDGDIIPDPMDNCPDKANELQRDIDRDGYGDFCDSSPVAQMAVGINHLSQVAEDIQLLKRGSAVVEQRALVGGASEVHDFFGGGFSPRMISVIDDYKQNGNDATLVLSMYVHAADGDLELPDYIPVARIKDLTTGEIVSEMTFFGRDHEVLDIDSIPDVTGNGYKEIVAVARRLSNGTLKVEVRDSADGTLIDRLLIYDREWFFRGMSTLPDLDGDGAPEVAVLAERVEDGRALVTVRNINGTGPRRRIWFLPSTFRPAGLLKAGDLDENGFPELAVLGQRESDGRMLVESRNAFGEQGKIRVPFFTFDYFEPTDFTLVNDSDDDGHLEYAVLGRRRSDGRFAVEVRNAIGTRNRHRHWYGDGYEPISIHNLGDSDSDSKDEFGVLMMRRFDQGLRLEIRNLRNETDPWVIWFSTDIFISLGTGNTLFEPDPTTYQQPWTVLVTDVEGVGMAGAPVDISVLSLQYIKGQYVAAPLQNRWAAQEAVRCFDEDTKFCSVFQEPNGDSRCRNGRLDADEDDPLVANPTGPQQVGGIGNKNSLLEAGNVAALSSGQLVTNDSGRADFNITYSQKFGNWVKVRLRVKTIVAGREFSETTEFVLPVTVDDVELDIEPPGGIASIWGTRASCQDAL